MNELRYCGFEDSCFVVVILYSLFCRVCIFCLKHSYTRSTLLYSGLVLYQIVKKITYTKYVSRVAFECDIQSGLC